MIAIAAVAALMFGVVTGLWIKPARQELCHRA